MEQRILEQNAPILYMKLYIPQLPHDGMGNTLVSMSLQDTKNHTKKRFDKRYPQ